jgi:hypothetical protein
MKKALLSFFLGCSLLSVQVLAENTTKPDTVAFADYPLGQEQFHELESTQDAQLPPEIKSKLPGLKISGMNHSDDLFMYTYKPLLGLKANTSYQVRFSLEFAANQPPDSIGVGGSPGSSVYVKIGAVSVKPERYIDKNYYRLALDKGNQGFGGKDLVLLGSVDVDNEDSIYQLKTLPYQPNPEMQEKLEHYTVTTNEKGEVWLIVGTDSGFEGKTTLYYTNVIASFKELSR